MNHIYYPCFPCYLRDLIVKVIVKVEVEGPLPSHPASYQTTPTKP